MDERRSSFRERELSAARDLRWRVRVERHSWFSLKSASWAPLKFWIWKYYIAARFSKFHYFFAKKMSLFFLKMTKTAKFKCKESILSLHMLFFLNAKHIMQALSERKENFASVKWAQRTFRERELSAALLLESERWVERRSRFSSTSASWAALFFWRADPCSGDHFVVSDFFCVQSISPLAKKRAPLNSRSFMEIASGAQLSAHFPAEERRSTRAREIFLALT